MSTNIGGVVLGSIVLAGSPSGSVTNTETVSQSVGLAQSISHTLLKPNAVTSTLSLSQVIDVQIVDRQLMSNNLAVSQSITRNVIYNKEVVSTLTLTQKVGRVISASVTSTLTLSQVIGLQVIHNVTLEADIGFTHAVFRQQIDEIRVGHGFGLESIVRAYRQFNKTVESDIGISDHIAFNTYWRTVTSNLNVSQNLEYIPVYPDSVDSELELEQEIELLKVLNLSVASTLVFPNTHDIYIGMETVTTVTLPNLIYALIKANTRACSILKTSHGSVVLPTPNWGDSEAYGGIFTIRRSMTNVAYTYIRSLSLRKLAMSYTLSKRKALELKAFLTSYGSEIMTFHTWKGDTWYVNLITNPFELTVSKRWADENEAVEVDLEFEGLKVM